MHPNGTQVGECNFTDLKHKDMNYTEEDLDNALDKLLIERGEHPSRVRHPIYGEERELAKGLVKLFCQPAVIKSGCENCSNTDFNETMGCKNYLQGFKCENFKQTVL